MFKSTQKLTFLEVERFQAKVLLANAGDLDFCLAPEKPKLNSMSRQFHAVPDQIQASQSPSSIFS